jgi:hypothetical protein
MDTKTNDEMMAEIYNMLKDLDDRLSKLETKNSDTGVITQGAPQFVKRFLEKQKEGTK